MIHISNSVKSYISSYISSSVLASARSQLGPGGVAVALDPCAEFESLNSDCASSTMLIMVSDSSRIEVWDRVGKGDRKVLICLSLRGPRSGAFWSQWFLWGQLQGFFRDNPSP